MQQNLRRGEGLSPFFNGLARRVEWRCRLSIHCDPRECRGAVLSAGTITIDNPFWKESDPALRQRGLEDFIKSAGDLFEGDLVQVSFRPFQADAGNSQLNTYKEWTEKSGGKVTEIGMEGWINADLAYQGLVAAGPNFTRESVIAATNQMKAFTAGGMIPAIDWSRQHEFPTDADPVSHGPVDDCRAFVRVKNQQFELVGPKGPRATNLAFLQKVLASPEFRSGQYDTGFIAKMLQSKMFEKGR